MDDDLNSGKAIENGALLKQSFFSTVLAVLVAVLCWGSFQIIELFWSFRSDGPLPHGISRLWATLSSVAVGAAAGAWVARLLRGMPLPTVHEGEFMAARINEERIRLASYWFIALRWLAVIGIFIVIFLGGWVFMLLPHEVNVPLIVTAVILACSNVFYLLQIQFSGTSRLHLLLQAYFDLILLTFLLHYSRILSRADRWCALVAS